MKNFIYTVTLVIAFPLVSTSCDICGCGVGNSYIGLLPEFRKQVFGLRYRYNSLYNHIGAGGSTTYLTSKENYTTLEVWGGWNIGKKFRIMATVPYSFNERINQGNKNSKNGLGDISIWGYYQLLNRRNALLKNKLLVQNLWIGGGIKLPTGRYRESDKSAGTNNTNLFQLGTGSFDFNLSAVYDVRFQDAGINLTANYKINGTNKQEYSYGNKIILNAQAYYKFNIKNLVSIAPNAGLLYEQAKTDRDNGFTVNISGGKLLCGTAGLEMSYKKVAVGVNFQSPLSQDLAKGIVKANNRMMIHISITL